MRDPRKRVILLISIMGMVTLIVGSVAIGLLYRAALNEERARLVELAKMQARLIEAIERFYDKHRDASRESPEEAVLSQITDAHNHYEGFGKTGEFTLSKREGDNIIFLLSHRHYDRNNPKPVPFSSKLAEPMRRALSGRSGTVVGLDYRGEKVLAAYEPVGVLGLGIVAKIDFSEIRAPFIKAALTSGLLGVVFILAGALFFVRVTNPLVRRLAQTIDELREALSNVKLLSGLLPICSSCKKIRDDKGYWNQIESYIRDHSEAEFSHSICPSCAKKLYPEIHLKDNGKIGG